MTTPERLCGSKRLRGDEETPIYIDDETDNDSDDDNDDEESEEEVDDDDDDNDSDEEDDDDYHYRRRRHVENWMSSIIGRSMELQRGGSSRPHYYHHRHRHHHHHQTTTRAQERVPPFFEESRTSSNDEREQRDAETTGSQIVFHSIRSPNVSVFIRPTGNFHSFFHLLSEIAGQDESSNNNGDDYEYFLRLDDSLPNRKGASEEQIERIPLKKLSTPPNRTCCCICLEEFTTGNDVKTLPCEHYFHPECIDQWLKVNGSCPIDRISIECNSKNDPIVLIDS